MRAPAQLLARACQALAVAGTEMTAVRLLRHQIRYYVVDEARAGRGHNAMRMTTIATI